MKNKQLESMLVEHKMFEVAKILERCEQGTIAEITVTEKGGMTGVAQIDKELYDYLNKLGVKVVFATQPSSDEKIEVKIYKEKSKVCVNSLHAIVEKRKKMDLKSKELQSKGYKLFKIESDVFVTCPECFAIHKLS
jgi:hypothetical protein